MPIPHPAPILAAGVAPEVGVVSVVAALVLLGLAGWFMVISHDIDTSFRRFQKLDARPGARPARSLDEPVRPRPSAAAEARSRPKDRTAGVQV